MWTIKSTSKAWRNVACLVASLLMLWYGYSYKVDAWLLLVYLATVGGFEWLSSLIKQRMGASGWEQQAGKKTAESVEK